MRSASPSRHPLSGLRLALGVYCLAGSLFAISTKADDSPQAPAAKEETPTEATDTETSEPQGAETATPDEAQGPPGPPKVPRARAKRACKGGWITDDGSADAGYGFVPSAREGIYLQQLRSDDLPSRRLDEVCVCLYKGLQKRRAEFDIVFYEDQNGRPAAEPYASLPARARIEPRRFRDAEFFFQVDASEVEVPEGSSFVGVRWDPQEQFHLFICGDKTETTDTQKGFYTEDRAKSWTDFATTRDPMFRDHRALMLRVRAQEPAQEEVDEGTPAPADPTPADPVSDPSPPPVDGGL